MTPENWDLVEIDDGTYYIAEYIGILDKAGRTEEETEAEAVDAAVEVEETTAAN